MDTITSLSPYQLKVLDLMGQVTNDEQMKEIGDLLSDYFASKAICVADEMWDEGKIGEATIDSWKYEHMRIPYSR